MKIVMILIGFSILHLSVKGQTSFFVNALPVWSIGSHYVDDNPMKPIDKWSTSFQTISEDTVIGSSVYKKVVESSDSFFTSKTVNCLIREDTTGKVFLRTGNSEIIAFDFGLKAGDTLLTDNLWKLPYQFYFKVDSVSTIILRNNQSYTASYVQVFMFSNNQICTSCSFPDVWVQGIGSLKYGLTYPILFKTGGCCPSVLLCFHENNQLAYQNPGYNTCYLNTDVNELVSAESYIHLFDNGYGNIIIENNANRKGTIVLYTIDGKNVANYKVDSKTRAFCPPGSGIYLYRFESSDGKVQTGKVLVR
jgi:hypothetical protein